MKALWQVGWSLYPSVLLGFGIWTLFYLLALRRENRPSPGQQIAFHLGTLAGLLALISPLDALGDEYLFSAHMIQHLLLMFVTAPLWLVGIPGWLINSLIPKGLDRRLNAIFSPIFTFAIFIGVLWFWHIPQIYELAQESEVVHIFEHLTFIGAALIGWWPILGAESARIPKPEPPVRMLYLFLLAIPCTGLAAILTFAQAPLYLFYIDAPHIFGLNAQQDQHLGGLLMWLPTHMFILLLLGVTFFLWFAGVGYGLAPENELVTKRKKLGV